MEFSGILPVTFEVLRCTLPLFDRHRSTVASGRFKETVIVLAKGGDHVGFGELSPLAKPLYEEQFLDAAQSVLVYLLQDLSVAIRRDGSLTSDRYREVLDSVSGWSSAKFAIDTAMADLNGRVMGLGPFGSILNWSGIDGQLKPVSDRLRSLDVEFGVKDFHIGLQGTSIGDFRDRESFDLIADSYRRVKIKVDAADFKEKAATDELVKFVREASSRFEVVVDFNETGPNGELLEQLQREEIAFFESPFRITSIEAAKRIFDKRRYRVAFDESLKDEQRLIDYLNEDLFDVAVLKPHRFNSLGDLISVVSRLNSRNASTEARASYYFGGMYDTPILRRVIAALTLLFPEGEASDLGPDSDYFSFPLLPSVVAEGLSLKVVGGIGLSGVFVPDRGQISSVVAIKNGELNEIH